MRLTLQHSSHSSLSIRSRQSLEVSRHASSAFDPNPSVTCCEIPAILKEIKYQTNLTLTQQYRKTVRPGSHTAGVAGRLWSEVAVASLKHRWNNKMRLPDENGGKDRRATFDDVGDHNVTTKTILGARVRQQVGVPHGAHHRRILEGEKKRGMRGPATRSAFWGCRACKAASRSIEK